MIFKLHNCLGESKRIEHSIAKIIKSLHYTGTSRTHTKHALNMNIHSYKTTIAFCIDCSHMRIYFWSLCAATFHFAYIYSNKCQKYLC